MTYRKITLTEFIIWGIHHKSGLNSSSVLMHLKLPDITLVFIMPFFGGLMKSCFTPNGSYWRWWFENLILPNVRKWKNFRLESTPRACSWLFVFGFAAFLRWRQSEKVAVILAGCGNLDGSEITDRERTHRIRCELGAQVTCFAPVSTFKPKSIRDSKVHR